jgi:hypothetical protein
VAEYDDLIEDTGNDSTWDPTPTSLAGSASGLPATRRRFRLGSLVMGVIFILIGLGGLTVDNSSDVNLLVDVEFHNGE